MLTFDGRLKEGEVIGGQGSEVTPVEHPSNTQIISQLANGLLMF